MNTKREYEEAFDLIDIFTSCGCNEVDDCNCCIAYNKRLKQQHGCELDLALNMFKELIEEHFELIDRCNYLEMTIHSLDCELGDAYNPRYCKFEDLKPNMWVYDNVAKECLYVVRPFITTGVRVKYFTCLGIWNLEKIKKLNMKFEENRFSLIKNDR